MKYLKLFENFGSENEHIQNIEDHFLELSDFSTSKLPIKVEVKSVKEFYKITIKYDFYDQVFVKNKVDIALNRLKRDYEVRFSRISKTGHGYNTKELPVSGTTRTCFVHDPVWCWNISVKPKEINESLNNKSILLIVDVQKSFKKFFNDAYLMELKRYCKNFGKVYQIFDNHVDGKNPDKDYLYNQNDEVENHRDLWNFPNQVDIIEKRYNYDVNVDFYKNILSDEVYREMKNKESEMKKGDYFRTTEGTIIVFVGNKHRFFHVPKKIYELFVDLKEAQKESDTQITIVGGAQNECLEDIVTTAGALGLDATINNLYTYSATHCNF